MQAFHARRVAAYGAAYDAGITARLAAGWGSADDGAPYLFHGTAADDVLPRDVMRVLTANDPDGASIAAFGADAGWMMEHLAEGFAEGWAMAGWQLFPA